MYKTPCYVIFLYMIYLDNNATTRLDPLVLQAMLPVLTDFYANASSNHAFGIEVNQLVKEARYQIASLINADPTEVIYTSGATESVNIALKGIAKENRQKGNHIITVETEHAAVLDTCRSLETEGYDITYLKVDRFGLIDLKKLEAAIKPTTTLITVMYVNNETGVIQPIKKISEIAHRHGAFFMSDGTQAVGKIPINVGALGIDALAFSAHKFYGPKGIGGLFLRSRRPFKTKVPAFIHGGGHEKGIRSGTLNAPGIIGMGKAASVAIHQINEDIIKIRQLRDHLEKRLLSLPNTFINGSTNDRCFNTSNICFLGVDADAIMVALKDIMISNGSACTSATVAPSHVLKAMGLSDAEAYSSIRFSVGRFNNREEIDYVAERISKVVDDLRHLV